MENPSLRTLGLGVLSGIGTLLALVLGVGWLLSWFTAPPSAPVTSNSVSEPVIMVGISPEQAALSALDVAVGSRLRATPTLLTLAGTQAYAVPLDTGTVYVDATTGRVLRNDTRRAAPAAPVAPPKLVAPAAPPAPATPAKPAASPAPAIPAAPDTGSALITQDQAVNAAINYAGGGTVRKVERETKRGIETYEVKFENGSEVYVDAYTGQVVYAELK